MTAKDNELCEAPQLSPDFAACVLRRAARIRMRRAFIGAGVAVMAVAIGAVLLWPGMQASPPMASLAWDTANAASAADDDQPATALDYLFPEATPLAQFVDRYQKINAGAGFGAAVLPADALSDRADGF